MAEMLNELLSKGIQKIILYPGRGDLPEFEDGSKMTFHYLSKKCDVEETVLDDSRTRREPMELIVGKKFKLDVWEICLKSMRVGEISKFIADRKHTAVYPHVAKSLRQINSGSTHEHSSPHCCGMAAMSTFSVGYPDLDELIKNPQPLSFTFELISIKPKDSYNKDVWEMSDTEKISAVPRLKETGNLLYNEGNYKEASEKYATAVGILDQLMLREKPNDVEWFALEEQRRPILSNYSQCLLNLCDYYAVIEHTSTILKSDPDNVKALFRRAKAHVGAWNPDDARSDFKRVATLNEAMKRTVIKELRNIDSLEKEQNAISRTKLQGKMFST